MSDSCFSGAWVDLMSGEADILVQAACRTNEVSLDDEIYGGHFTYQWAHCLHDRFVQRRSTHSLSREGLNKRERVLALMEMFLLPFDRWRFRYQYKAFSSRLLLGQEQHALAEEETSS